MSKQIHIHVHTSNTKTKDAFAKMRDALPSDILSMISRFEERARNPRNYTEILMSDGTKHAFNSIMYQLEKIYKAKSTSPEDKELAGKKAGELQRNWSTKIDDMLKQSKIKDK